MEPRFETYPRADGDFGWRLVDGNAEKVAAGEGYTRRSDAERAVRNVITTVVDILVLHDAIIAQHLMVGHVGIFQADAEPDPRPPVEHQDGGRRAD